MVGDFCLIKLEKYLVGFSVFLVECIIGCVCNYERVFGKFSKIKNNCYMFINRMVDIFCYNIVCFNWCMV